MSVNSIICARDLWHKLLAWISERRISTINIDLEEKGDALEYNARTYESRELTYNGKDILKADGEARIDIHAPINCLEELSHYIIDFIRNNGHKYKLIRFSAPQSIIEKYVPPPNACKCSLKDALKYVKDVINQSEADVVNLYLSTAVLESGGFGDNETLLTNDDIEVESITLLDGTESFNKANYVMNLSNAKWAIHIEGELEVDYGNEQVIELNIRVNAPRSLWKLIINNVKRSLDGRKLHVVNEDKELEESIEYKGEEDYEADGVRFVIGPN
ncbi:hypothetical protein VMUT_1525 [Vulcanisaeta moutnovskia 768-28]|uniref:Uncharacterized protein n=1 Tax=Vulcanisaeta moutnovskia (strain 768-28) TaxID=985053 RepID=F0QTL6_VULM7|nr:hypothetical protein [Vulcanisaeta moutnovskia]ADY01729.1 hypothetical protein VMUT_1525 [Vulcanisaeta moutnovskia 768-28]